MAISPINNLNNNIRNLSFGENKEKPDTEKKSQISTQTKVIVGTGLAALAAVGIYIATRGKFGKQVGKPKVTQKTEEIAENIEAKFEKILEKFNEGPYKNATKKVKQLDNGKRTITLGEGSNRTVYIYDKNANPERQINFVNKGYTVSVPTENGAWDMVKTKRRDVKTGDTIIEKYGKYQLTSGTKMPIEETIISREEKNGLTEFRKHKYIKNNDGPADEETVLIRSMKLDDDNIRTFRKASLKPNESSEWNVQSCVLKNNERMDKPFFEILTPEQMQKWKSALGLN